MGTETKQGPDDLLGQWVQRVRHSTGNDLTYWHKVETVVNDAPTSHCGHTFLPLDRTDLIYSPTMPPLRWCWHCNPGGV